jgi:hypothetical protein
MDAHLAGHDRSSHDLEAEMAVGCRRWLACCWFAAGFLRKQSNLIRLFTKRST